MSDDEETVMFSGRIPKSLKQLIDADERTNQQVLRDALWDQFGGQRMSDIEREISEKERRLEVVDNEIQPRLNEKETLQNELEALRRKKDRVKEDKSELWEAAEEAVTVARGEIVEGEQYLAHHASNLNMTVEELRTELIERCNDE